MVLARDFVKGAVAVGVVAAFFFARCGWVQSCRPPAPCRGRGVRRRRYLRRLRRARLRDPLPGSLSVCMISLFEPVEPQT